MAANSDPPGPAAIHEEARALWSDRRLPPPEGPVGPPDGPVVRQFLGAFAPQESGTLVAQRALAADVDARALILAGRRAQGILRKEDGGPPVAAPRLDPVLSALGTWVGGAEGRPWDGAPRRPEVQRLVGRLAHLGVLAVRDVSLRICPACARARSPEGIIYQEEDGETLLVRFPFSDGERTVSALAWTDAPWRLLGTSALMIHPDLPYVIARYRRKDVDELIFTSKSSIARLEGWLPGATIDVLEEHPGRHWEGRAYVHPLRHEFPMGGALEPPGGTILPIPEVSDSGTGVVPLVPGHGGTDTQIADRLRVPGWPLVTPKGRFDILFVHKYAGLELQSGSDFVARDLDEGGAVFARLRVRRGVPRCVRCGTALIWAPGRAWCLEPSRLPSEKLALYRTLLPRERPIERLEAVPWPVSEPQRSDDPLAVALLECASCDRLDAADERGDRCACGGRRRVVRRRLLAAFDATVSAWASVDPFASADGARLYVNERRRAPTVVHHIAAMSGVAGGVGEVRLVVLPTLPDADLLELIAAHGADAVRAALVRSQGPERATTTLAERCAAEAHRLAAFLRAAAAVRAPIDAATFAGYAEPIGERLGDLEPEDRAFLARLERLRVQALVDYDRSRPELVHRRLFQFVENDLATYGDWVAPRLAVGGTPPGKRAAGLTLVHAIFTLAQLLAPIAPHTAEVVHRSLHRSRASVFEEPPMGVDRALLDPARAAAWDRWVGILRAVDRFRRAQGIPRAKAIPSVALIVAADSTADELRADATTIERLGGIGRLEVGSPGAPWAGRRRQLRPREAEVQRVYPSQAAQIVHLLKRMPERKATDSTPGQGFSMIVNGQPTQILPSMFTWEATIPERFVPTDWAGGELYAELPGESAPPPAPLPPLSPDGFRFAARLRHRLRSVPSPTPRVAVVAAPPELATELAQAAGPLAKHLGLAELRCVGSERELPPGERGFGRTRAGAAWWFHVSDPGATARPKKHRASRGPARRVRPAYRPGDLSPATQDYADGPWIEREAGIRALGEELDGLLGSPLLGPAKVAVAWDAGLRDVDAFRTTPYLTLAGLPGFGAPVAGVLVAKLGGRVPAEAAAPRRRPRSAPIAATERRGPPRGASRAAPTAAPAATAPRIPPGEVGPSRPDDDADRAPTPSPPAARALPEAVEEVPAAEPAVRLPPDRPAEPPPPEAGEPESVPVSEPVADLPAPELPIAAPSAPEAAAPSSELPVSPAPEPIATSPEGLAGSEPMVPGTPTTEGPTESVPADATDIGSVPSGTVRPSAEPTAVSEAPSAPTNDATAPEPAPGNPSAETEPALEDSTPPAPDAPTLPEEPTVPEEGTASAPKIEPAIPAPSGESTAAGPTAEEPAPGEVPVPAADVPVPEIAPAVEDASGPVAPPPPRPEGPEVAPVAAPTEPSAEAPPHTATEPPGAAPAALEVPPLPPAEVPPDGAPTAVRLRPPEAMAPVAVAPVPSIAESLGFPPVDALARPAPPPAPPPEAGVDLLVGPSYLPSLERFLEATAAGHQGICVVRDSPERVRAYIGSRPVEIRWLTNIGRGLTLKPTDLEGFSAFLAHALTEGHVTAIFLEGIEYLVRLHGLDRVIERMAALDRLAREHTARVWLPLNPKLLSPAELDRFVATFRPGPAPADLPPGSDDPRTIP